MSELAVIYDFETALESAVKTVLTAQGLVVYVSNDVEELQRQRPRVELQMVVGSATDHRTTHDSIYRCDCYTGQMVASIVTNSGDGTAGHASYRAQVRAAFGVVESTLTDDANDADTLLPDHSVNRFFESGTSPTVKPDDGYYESRLVFDLHFNIRPASWPA